jgi:hypothetical protein
MNRIPARRFVAIAFSLVLGVGLLAGLAGPAQAALPKNCKDQSTSHTTIITCVTITSNRKNSKFRVADTDALVNTTNRTAEFSCEITKTKTWNYSASTTIGVEAGVIFTKAKAEVTFALAHSRASGKSTRAGIKVPAHTTTYCDRGVYTHSYTGKVKQTRCSSSSCITRNGTFKLTAPSTAAWRFRDA